MALTQISTKGIKDGTITNADIGASAAIAGTKISPTFSSHIEIQNTSPKITFTDTDSNPDHRIQNSNGTLNFHDITNGVTRLQITTDGNVQIPNDAGKLQIGASQDLQLYHTGSANHIDCSVPTAIRSDVFQVSTLNGTHKYIDIPTDEQGVELYYDNSKKFETLTNGVRVTGQVDVNGGGISLEDSRSLLFGASDDLQIYHDGSNSYIKDSGTGFLIIESNQLQIKNDAADEKMIVADANGAVELYHDNSKKLETTSAGVTITGDLDATGLNVADDIVHLNDTDTKIAFADNQVMVHTGGTEALDIRSDGAMIFGHHDEISFNSAEAIRLNIPANADLDNAGNNRDTKGKITIAAGDADNATPDDDCTVIQITPESVRNATVGSKHGGIAWQHLTPLNWTGYQGNQIWMGSSLHDTSGQERANFQVWMNNQTTQGSQPNNHAFNLSPEGYHSFPKTPVWIGEGTNYSQNSSSYSDVIPASDLTTRGITRSGASLTVPEDGVYFFSLNALWHPGGENIYFDMRLVVNGTQAGDLIQGGQTQTAHFALCFTKLVVVSANDALKFQFKASAGKVYSGQANWTLFKVA